MFHISDKTSSRVIVLSGFSAVVIFTVLSVFTTSSLSLEFAVAAFFGVMVLCFEVLLFRTRVRSKRAAGQFLLKISFNWQNWIYILMGGWFLFFALNEWITEGSLSDLLIFSPIGFFWLIAGTHNYRFYQRGLLLTGRFFPWSDLKTFRWQEDRPNTLIIHRNEGGKYIRIPVKKNQKNEVDRILSEYLPLKKNPKEEIHRILSEHQPRRGFGMSDAVLNQQENQTP